jgi:hypothetical protein
MCTLYGKRTMRIIESKRSTVRLKYMVDDLITAASHGYEWITWTMLLNCSQRRVQSCILLSYKLMATFLLSTSLADATSARR